MYQFTSSNINNSLEDLWAIISIDLRKKNFTDVSSITGVLYKISEVTNVAVTYSAPSRNGGKKEDLSKTDFINFLSVLRKHSLFNTASIKSHLPTEIYAKRSPLFAVLLALNIIEKIN